jgi:TRAP-type mannitol/chloroaromatic compound transport system substrate-binding protein
MRRRDILAGAGSLVAGATLSFPAPAIAQGIRQLKMATDWPERLPGLQTSAVRFAQTVGAATGDRIKIEVFPAGALVRPFESFDAVGAGVADMYHSAEYYWQKRSPMFSFFAAIPFGFTADELFAWVHHGDGQELWDALSGQFNVKPLLCTSTGAQMGGWFTRELTSLEGFRGLRYRMPEPGAEVLRRLGAIVVTFARRRDRPGAQVRRHRRQRMGWPVARHGARPAQSGGLLLLPRVSRAGHRRCGRHQQGRVGKLRCQ